MRVREFAARRVDRRAELGRQLHRSPDLQLVVCGHGAVAVALKKHKPGKVVGLALEQVCGFRVERLVAILKQAK
jgi:hypothetical protein